MYSFRVLGLRVTNYFCLISCLITGHARTTQLSLASPNYMGPENMWGGSVWVNPPPSTGYCTGLL